ncbi:hypothetical protein QTL97_13045 [Sporosarcina thermotolerans]|uniref:Uncharacterized protein n=1 Tax=Sporosarcina thermotolerans TaxID=633404 RepID=A0AAW9A8U0_9BACL|nr:hypothetical protein [Sporosarcina thermotolerans]MDW0117867.1 hypothetical protein [Sporosarcina thermotolerans]WHT49326.1 hypothetical protein QNH10_07005 [Sporosarcina thermotolerans]
MGLLIPKIAATKTANSVVLNEVIVYDWSIVKTATPENITFNFFASDTIPVHYRITADRFVQSETRTYTVSGSVCVSNYGNATTTGLEILDEIQFRAAPDLDFTTIAGPFPLTGLHELAPGEIACFPYEISFSDHGPGEYRNVAVVSIDEREFPLVVTAPINVTTPTCTNLTEIDERATIESDQIIEQPGGFLPGFFDVSGPIGISFPILLDPTDTPQVFNYTRNIFKGILTFVEGDVVNRVTLVEDDSGEIRQTTATVHLNTIFFGLTEALPVNIAGRAINTVEELVEFSKNATEEQRQNLMDIVNRKA